MQSSVRIRRQDQEVEAPVSVRTLLVLLLVTTTTTTAFAAPTKQECVSTHAEGQRLRDEGKLHKARASFATCSSPSCPGPVQSECIQFQNSLTSAIPTVVVRVVDGDHDVADAKILADDEVVATKVDGLPIELDPGQHVVKATLADGRTAETRLLLGQSEKDRQLKIVFAAVPVKTVTKAPSLAVKEVPPPPPSRHTIPTEGWVLAGVGLVAMGVGTGFWLDGRSKERAAQDSCVHNCPNDVTRPIKTSNTIGDVTFTAGVVAVLAAGYFVFRAWQEP